MNDVTVKINPIHAIVNVDKTSRVGYAFGKAAFAAEGIPSVEIIEGAPCFEHASGRYRLARRGRK